jgi:hypothetical protein
MKFVFNIFGKFAKFKHMYFLYFGEKFLVFMQHVRAWRICQSFENIYMMQLAEKYYIRVFCQHYITIYIIHFKQYVRIYLNIFAF